MIHSNSIIKTNNDSKKSSIGKDYSQTVAVSEEQSEVVLADRNTTEIPVIENTGEILVDVSSTGRTRNWSEKKKMNLELSEIFEFEVCRDDRRKEIGRS